MSFKKETYQVEGMSCAVCAQSVESILLSLNGVQTANVNFAGAVIYDTKKAAEQALADRVTKVMNESRRGRPQRRNS